MRWYGYVINVRMKNVQMNNVINMQMENVQMCNEEFVNGIRCRVGDGRM
jgi:hypothetical protein